MATEKRLIDLDKIKPIDFPSTEMDGLDVVRYLSTLPPVEAVEVVHGQWELYPSHMHRRCSVCKVEYDKPKFNIRANYCPNCGAKMDGDGNG